MNSVLNSNYFQRSYFVPVAVALGGLAGGAIGGVSGMVSGVQMAFAGSMKLSKKKESNDDVSSQIGASLAGKVTDISKNKIEEFAEVWSNVFLGIYVGYGCVKLGSYFEHQFTELCNRIIDTPGCFGFTTASLCASVSAIAAMVITIRYINSEMQPRKKEIVREVVTKIVYIPQAIIAQIKSKEDSNVIDLTDTEEKLNSIESKHAIPANS